MTCCRSDDHIEGVDGVAQVVDGQPQTEELLLDLPEDGPKDETDEVVEDRRRDDAQPSEVEA